MTAEPFVQCMKIPCPRCGAKVREMCGPEGRSICHAREHAWEETRASREARADFLDGYRPVLVTYLRAKLEAEDWHGVQDAASDLRDLDSELDGLRY